MQEKRTTRTGFIGLGSQGGPMARRMVEAGYPLTLWARRPQALDVYHDTPAQFAASIAELGAACDHVGVCVVDDAGVRLICDELLSFMRAGSVIAIHSTVHPQTCIDLAAQAGTRGIGLVDAPVSGGGGGAEAGVLTVMVGGEDDVVARARPVFESFGRLIVHLGGVGAGQLAKLVNNSLMAAHVALGFEAVQAAVALGIDKAAFVDLVQASSGRSFGFDVAARLPAPDAFQHGASLLAKDVRLLRDVLGEHAASDAFDRASNDFLRAATKNR